jgi:RNA polymerase-binding transcription factor DksA
VDESARRRAERRLDAAEEEARAMAANTIETGLGASLKRSTGALSAYDNHPSDLGNTTFEREADVGVLTAARRRLADIRQARRRLEEGAYGTCTSCGRTIPEARLEAAPWSCLCVVCQEAQDAAAGRRAAAVRAPRHGLTAASERSASGLAGGSDRQDAWRQVARYGSSSTPQDEPPDGALPPPPSPLDAGREAAPPAAPEGREHPGRRRGGGPDRAP